MDRQRLLTAVLAVVIVASGIGGVVTVTAQESGTDTLGLEELAPGGSKPANAPPSIRKNGRYGEFAVKILPTGLLVNEDKRSPSWRYLRQGRTVRRNYLQLWSKRAYGAESQQYVVEIAHYNVGKKTIKSKDGSTRRKKIAENVQTYSRNVTFSGGYDFARINLKPHWDSKVRTVMCVREPNEESCLTEPGDTRWKFVHSSSKATLPIDTNSAGARLAWGLLSLVLPFFGTTTGTLFIGKRFVDKAKAGPQISAVWWILTAVAGLIFVVAAWDWLAETLIRAPWLISAAAGVLLGIIAVEWFGRRTYGVGFLQFKLSDGFDPTDPAEVGEAIEEDPELPDDPEEISPGELEDLDPDRERPQDAPGVLKAEFNIVQFARGNSGEPSAIRKGIRRFWARARGAHAPLEVDGNMQTKIDVDGPLEELYLLDPESNSPLAYEGEHHEIVFPPLVTTDEEGNRQIHPVPYIAGLGALGLSAGIGQLATGSWLLGTVVGGTLLTAFRLAKPVSGQLWADLAPVHYHHAVATMLTHARGLADAKSWEEWFTEYADSEAESHADRRELLDQKDQSQLEELFDRYVGDSGDSSAVKDGGDRGDGPGPGTSVTGDSRGEVPSDD